MIIAGTAPPAATAATAAPAATAGAWWPVALSEAVQGEKPLAVVCDGEPMVVFRNADGQVCALEDRCPHRRVPLSLGVVKPAGLQCGYHGWTFNGSSGACVAIPNLHADERVPARYAARAFTVTEADGLVQVWRGAGTPSAALPTAGWRPEGAESTGSTVLSLGFDETLAVMLDGPELLLAFPGVCITDFFLGDAVVEGDALVLDRGAVWPQRLLPPAFVTDHPLILRTAVPLQGGTMRVQLLTADETPLVSLLIAATPHLRGTTGLVWRGFRHAGSVRGAAWRWRLARTRGQPAFSIRRHVDGAALSALLVAPSRGLASARAKASPGERLAA